LKGQTILDFLQGTLLPAHFSDPKGFIAGFFPRDAGFRFVILAVVAFLFVFLMPRYVHAHAGHGNEEVGGYDLDAPRAPSPETAKHMELKTEEVGTQRMEEILALSGVVKPLPDRHLAVVSRVEGRLVFIAKQMGDQVKRGEVLARIESPEQARSLYDVRKLEVEYQKLLLEIERSRADAQRKRAEVESAKAQFVFAEGELARDEKLGRAIAQTEVAQRRAAWAQAKSDLRQREIDLPLAEKTAANLAQQAEALKFSREALLTMNNIDPGVNIGQQLSSILEVKAETEGVVIARPGIPGRWVRAGETILEVADYSAVQIDGELPESLIARVRDRKSDKVRIRTPADPRFLGEGKIRFLAPELEPVKRTAHVIVEASNPEGVLRGEMWVDLAIVLQEQDEAIVVPKAAVIVDGPMHFVFVEQASATSQAGAGSIYRKQDINPGISNDLFVEVKDGVYPGDMVVTQGAVATKIT